jgi:flagellin
VANAQIQVDLSGVSNRADSTSLGLASTSVAAGSGSNDIGGAAIDLRSGTFLANSTQVFTFQLAGSSFTATVGTGGSAITGQDAVNQLNSQIAPLGITAAIDQTTGQLSFTGGVAFNVLAGAVTGGGSAIATATGTAQNTADYISNGAASYAAPTTTTEALTFTVNGNSTLVTLATGTTQAVALSQLNAALNSQGIYAVNNTAGTGIDFQSAQAFTVSTAGTAAEGVYAATGVETVTAPVPGQSVTGNALAAIAGIQQAVANLGLIQGKVGTGENELNFSISLANSQITNFSAAESHIRDADVAAAAANLTKAQTLQQTSIAALAQANAAPAAVLKLLQ